jgi:transketolase
MRKQFCDAMVARATSPAFVFLTGDLGFMALEPLQEALGQRFINAGIAEQNMVSVAAAMAREGMDPWVYSIAPFVYARPFEQIRNDVAFHKLPVRIVGNGGGYGYGVMGATHHAIEDYGVMLSLSGMQVCVPVFDEDVALAMDWVSACNGPVYLRLGRGEPPKGYAPAPWAPWRQLVAGGGATVVAVGPLAGTYIDALRGLPEHLRPNLWAVSALPVVDHPPPEAFLSQLQRSRHLVVAEEHVANGGLASSLVLWLALHQSVPQRVVHLCATAHTFDRYGSQTWLRAQVGLDAQSLIASLATR